MPPPCFIISFWLAIGQNKHPIRCQPLSYSSQCSTLTTSLRKYQTSSFVQSMIGFITILSLPLTHCTPSTSWLRVNWSNCSKLPLNRSVFFALIISASFLWLRCTDSSRLTPVSVTVPAPLVSFSTAQQKRIKRVGKALLLMQSWAKVSFGLSMVTSGYLLRINITNSGGSKVVRL